MKAPLLITLLYLSSHVDAKVLKGFIKEGTFEFLGKFCFDWTYNGQGTAGLMEADMTPFEGENPVANGLDKTKILLFDDEDTQWDSLIHFKTKCQEKVARAKWAMDLHLTKSYQHAKFEPQLSQHIRPRFWYVVLANCDGFRDVRYSVRLTNTDRWEINREFGTNDQGFLLIYFVFFCVFTYVVYKHLRGLPHHAFASSTIDRRPTGKKIMMDMSDFEAEYGQLLNLPDAAVGYFGNTGNASPMVKPC